MEYSTVNQSLSMTNIISMEQMEKLQIERCRRMMIKLNKVLDDIHYYRVDGVSTWHGKKCTDEELAELYSKILVLRSRCQVSPENFGRITVKEFMSCGLSISDNLEDVYFNPDDAVKTGVNKFSDEVEDHE